MAINLIITINNYEFFLLRFAALTVTTIALANIINNIISIGV